MLLEKDIENLKWANYRVPRNDKENHISFIEGYLLAKDDKEFTQYISIYLNQIHGINIELNTFIEQLDHYSFKNQQSLLDGFFDLLCELEEYNQILNPEAKDSQEIPYNEEITGEVKKAVQLKDGRIIKAGDFIQLTDKVGEDYKLTKFYDASLRNPSWELFYPSEKDFKYLQLYYRENNSLEATIFGQVWRIFSNSIAKVEKIYVHNDITILYTDIFKIKLEEALQSEEIQIISSPENKVIPTDLSSLKQQFQNYTIGVALFRDLIREWCIDHLPLLNNKWQRSSRNMNGVWFKTKPNAESF